MDKALEALLDTVNQGFDESGRSQNRAEIKRKIQDILEPLHNAHEHNQNKKRQRQLDEERDEQSNTLYDSLVESRLSLEDCRKFYWKIEKSAHYPQQCGYYAPDMSENEVYSMYDGDWYWDFTLYHHMHGKILSYSIHIQYEIDIGSDKYYLTENSEQLEISWLRAESLYSIAFVKDVLSMICEMSIDALPCEQFNDRVRSEVKKIQSDL